MIYLICDSRGLDGPSQYNKNPPPAFPSYANILKRKREIVVYSFIPSVLDAWGKFKLIKLTSEDIVIFHLGINDCIYRKNKEVQQVQFEQWLSEAQKRNDTFAIALYSAKIAYIKSKPRDETFQWLQFDDFEIYVDEMFKEVGSRGIVLSINYFLPTQPRMGFTFKQEEETNTILKRKAEEYKLTYLDLWEDKIDRTEDGAHFTKEGNEYVAEKLEIILESLEMKKV